MLDLIAKHKGDKDVEFSVQRDRMRPSEAEKLFGSKS